MPGEHNRQNMLMVTAAAQAIGLSNTEIETGLRSFPACHRLEALDAVANIAVYNDSKATNYDAAAVALRAMPCTTVVLAGGQTKQGDAQDWLEQLQNKACSVVLFGAGAQELKQLITSSGFEGDLHCCNDLTAAVPKAISEAQRLGADNLLLSPACASFDQYKDFEARGEHFRQLVKQQRLAQS